MGLTNGMTVAAMGAFPGGDMVIVTFDVVLQQTAEEMSVVLDYGSFKPTAFISCTTPGPPDLTVHEKMPWLRYFHDTRTMKMYFPTGLQPHFQITLVGTLSGERIE